MSTPVSERLDDGLLCDLHTRLVQAKPREFLMKEHAPELAMSPKLIRRVVASKWPTLACKFRNQNGRTKK